MLSFSGSVNEHKCASPVSLVHSIYGKGGEITRKIPSFFYLLDSKSVSTFRAFDRMRLHFFNIGKNGRTICAPDNPSFFTGWSHLFNSWNRFACLNLSNGWNLSAQSAHPIAYVTKCLVVY
jgi:hypothetical protein